MPTPLGFRLEFLGLRALTAIMRALPTDVAVRMSGRLWRLVAPRLKRHPRADRHLAAAMPELSAEQRRAILHDMWSHLGMTFAEAILLDRIASEPSRIEGLPADLARVTDARGRAMVFVSLHLGNWEALAVPLAKAGVRFAGVYQRMRNPLVESYVVSLREPFYVGGLHAKSAQALRRIMKHVRDGGSVGLLSDLRDIRGVPAPFFGRMAPSTPFPAVLARQHGAPLVAGWMERIGPGRLRLHSEEITVPVTADKDADILQATANIQACFERWIRAHPAQWMWAHRRYER